jgi:hypothetical protein
LNIGRADIIEGSGCAARIDRALYRNTDDGKSFRVVTECPNTARFGAVIELGSVTGGSESAAGNALGIVGAGAWCKCDRRQQK